MKPRITSVRSLERHAKKAKRAALTLPAQTVDLLDLRGCIKPRVRGVTLEDMQAAIGKALQRRARKR